MTGLTQVLAFAEAVGSFKGVCRVACSQMQQLKFVVLLPEQLLKLPLADYTYIIDGPEGAADEVLTHFKLQVQRLGDTLVVADTETTFLAHREQCLEVKQQVARQLSALLRAAQALRQQQLLDVLHQFIMRNADPAGGDLLSGVMGLVFTDDVLEAALVDSNLSKEAYVQQRAVAAVQPDSWQNRPQQPVQGHFQQAVRSGSGSCDV